MGKIVFTSDKKHLKKDFGLSKKARYHGHTIQFGVDVVEKLMVIFVDRTWLASCTMDDVFPFDEHDTEKIEELDKRAKKMIRIAKKLIDEGNKGR